MANWRIWSLSGDHYFYDAHCHKIWMLYWYFLTQSGRKPCYGLWLTDGWKHLTSPFLKNYLKVDSIGFFIFNNNFYIFLGFLYNFKGCDDYGGTTDRILRVFVQENQYYLDLTPFKIWSDLWDLHSSYSNLTNIFTEPTYLLN